MGVSRQGYLEGVVCHAFFHEIFWLRDQTRVSPASPALAGGFFTTVPPGKLFEIQTFLKTSYRFDNPRLPFSKTWKPSLWNVIAPLSPSLCGEVGASLQWPRRKRRGAYATANIQTRPLSAVLCFSWASIGLEDSDVIRKMEGVFPIETYCRSVILIDFLFLHAVFICRGK